MKKFSKSILIILVFCLAFTACAQPVPLLQTSSENVNPQSESQNSQQTNEQSSISQSQSTSSIENNEEITQAYSTTLDDIKNRGTLIIGIDDSFEPLSYVDSAGNYVGLDIDLATQICEIIGVSPEFKAVKWNDKQTALNSGEVDMLMSGLIVTQDRAQSINFSTAYLNSILIVLTNPGINVNAAADLAGLSIGIQQARTIVDVAEQSYIYDSIKNDIIEYPNYDQIFSDMQNNILDCTIVPSVYGMYANLNMDNAFTTAKLDFGDAPIAIGTRITDVELSSAVDEALLSLMQDGTVEDLNMKWFNMDIFVIR